MWTHVSIYVHPVWDEGTWTVTACWQDDNESEPVHLTRSGRCSLTGLDSPELILQGALNQLRPSALDLPESDDVL